MNVIPFADYKYRDHAEQYWNNIEAFLSEDCTLQEAREFATLLVCQRIEPSEVKMFNEASKYEYERRVKKAESTGYRQDIYRPRKTGKSASVPERAE